MSGLPHAVGSENPSMLSIGVDRGSARAARRRLSRLAHDLRTALSVEPQAQLFLVYQPVMDVIAGVILGQEALIRWAHPVLGELQPGRFIPMAEAFGLIWQVGEWVLHAACLQGAADCRKRGVPWPHGFVLDHVQRHGRDGGAVRQRGLGPFQQSAGGADLGGGDHGATL